MAFESRRGSTPPDAASPQVAIVAARSLASFV
jgi:hypothetical protein